MGKPDPDHHFLDIAARLALRGHGGAEPNPMVGCVIASDGEVVGWGYHRRCGGPHAEVEALGRAGSRARGATAFVTLEPCAHTGRTGPCTTALIDAGLKRVAIGCADPTPAAQGGAGKLEEAGIDVTWCDHEPSRLVSAPYIHRVRTGLPWVVAKWAQTLDGRLATRTGRSQWISSEHSRRMVHRERGRVDAILTGIGTVLADDPLLTARCRRPRRIPRRVVIDRDLQTPADAQLVSTAGEVPTVIACSSESSESDQANLLRERGVTLVGIPCKDGVMDLAAVMRNLVDRWQASTVLVEAGPRLLSALMRERLVNEAWVFTGPRLMGDEQAMPVLRGFTPGSIEEAMSLHLIDLRRRGDDVVTRYLVESARTPERESSRIRDE